MGMIMKDGIPYGGIYPIDDAPTQGSNNAVKSGGVFSSLSNKVDKVAGKGLSTNDYDNTEKGKVSANTSAIEAIVNVYGSKNLVNVVGVNTSHRSVPYTNIQYGLTFTFNADTSITVSGVATGTGDVWDSFPMAHKLKQGRYALSCTASATYDITKFFGVDNIQWGSVIDGKDHIREVTGGDLAIIFHVESGADFSTPVTFYPMVRDSRISDNTWVPHAMTNAELTEMFPKRPTRLVGIYGAIYQHGYGLFIPYDSRLYGTITPDMINSIEISWLSGYYSQNIRVDTHQNMLAVMADDLPADPQYIGDFAAVNLF